MLEEAGHLAEVVPGGKGQFDIEADGKLVFSKWREHRFPEADEVVTLLA